MRTIALLLCAQFIPVLAAAQATQNADAASDLGDLPVPGWARSVIDSFSKPVHPVVGGVASGGGLGLGVAYDSPDETGWFQQAETMVTVRRYWGAEGEIGHRSASKRSQIGAFAAVRHMGRLDYFGIGPDTVFDDRAAFRLREHTFGGRGWFRVAPVFRFGGAVAAYVPDIGRGASPTVRPLEDVFSRISVPGFDAQPKFGRYRGFVEFTHTTTADLAMPEDAERFRGAYQFAVEAVRDHSTGTHDFKRVEMETQHRIPGFRPGQRLTLHGFVATTHGADEVPFYMLYTLGGSGGLKTFRPEMLGGDGTRASLRGFRNYRFRDRNIVLMQAEYRIPVHKYIHTSVFVDAGQVAPRAPQLLSDLRANTGFSASFVRKGKTVGRMDVGFGGGEGVHLFWSFGAFQD
jgi:hypothetical protein